MNDHQTWSMKLWYKYWILTFFKYSEAIKTISEEDINGLPSCPILQRSEKIRENILTMFDSQTWSKKDMLTMYDHETWSN